MNFLDVACEHSGNLSDSSFQSKGILILGQYGGSFGTVYLYFNIQPYFFINRIVSSDLILYKLPRRGRNDVCSDQINDFYCLYPTSAFYMDLNCNDSGIHIIRKYETCFTIDTRINYTKIDITRIVKNWFAKKLDNKGLLITGQYDSAPVIYTAHNFKDSTLHPVIRITYENMPGKKVLKEIPCIVKITGH